MIFIPGRVPSDQAFEQFLGEQHPILVSYLRKYGISHDDAEDIAQESLLKLTRYCDLPPDALKPLLYRISINVLRDLRRRSSVAHRKSIFDPIADAHDIPDELPQPEQWTAHRQELARVRAAVDQLPARCREVYLLNRIDGMSYSQIAQHCGISVKAVEKHVGKALSSLRTLLSVQAESSDTYSPKP